VFYRKNLLIKTV